LPAFAGLTTLLGGNKGGDASRDGGRIILKLLPIGFVLLPHLYVVSFRHFCRWRLGGGDSAGRTGMVSTAEELEGLGL